MQTPKWLLSVNVIINVVVVAGDSFCLVVVVAVLVDVTVNEWEILELWSDAAAAEAPLPPLPVTIGI